MLLDAIDDPTFQFIAEGQVNPFLDMGKDDQGTHGWREFIMRIMSRRHVFGKVLGLYQFPNVMKISADTAESRVGSNLLGTGFGQVGHCQ